VKEQPSLLSQADENLPALQYAVELQLIAAKVGFDWPEVSGVVDKIEEELSEVMVESKTPDNQARLLDEIGDLLFACTNLARHLGIDPEQAIQAGNTKFYRRFSQIEQHIQTHNTSFSDLSLEELDQLWDQAKTQENK